MNHNNRPIGGLTTLKTIVKMLPNECIIFLVTPLKSRLEATGMSADNEKYRMLFQRFEV